MYNNIGKTIKVASTVFAIIGMLASLIGGISLAKISEYFIGVGFSVIVIGILFSWVGSAALYGFGELIEKTSALSDHFCGGGGAQSSNRADQLFKLKQQGLISDAEYAEKLKQARGE